MFQAFNAKVKQFLSSDAEAISSKEVIFPDPDLLLFEHQSTKPVGHFVSELIASPNGKWVAYFLYFHDSLEIINLENGVTNYVYAHFDMNQAIGSISFSHDSEKNFVISNRGSAIRILKFINGEWKGFGLCKLSGFFQTTPKFISIPNTLLIKTDDSICISNQDTPPSNLKLNELTTTLKSDGVIGINTKGTFLAYSNDSKLFWTKIINGQTTVTETNRTGEFKFISVSNNEKYVSFILENGDLSVISIEHKTSEHTQIFTKSGDYLKSCFSPDDDYLCTIGKQYVTIFRVLTGEESFKTDLNYLPHVESVECFCVCWSGKNLLIGSNNALFTYNDKNMDNKKLFKTAITAIANHLNDKAQESIIVNLIKEFMQEFGYSTNMLNNILDWIKAEIRAQIQNTSADTPPQQQTGKDPI